MKRLVRFLLPVFGCVLLLSLGRWVIAQGESTGDNHRFVEGAHDITQPLSNLEVEINYGLDTIAGYTTAYVTVYVRINDTLGTFKEEAILTADSSGYFILTCIDWSGSHCPMDIVPGDLVYVRADGFERTYLVGEISGSYDPAENAITGGLNAGWVTNPAVVRCEIWARITDALMIITQADPNGGFFECDFDDVGWTPAPPQIVVLRYFDDQGDSVINTVDMGWPHWLKLSSSAIPEWRYYHDHPVVAYNWQKDDFLAVWQFARWNSFDDQYDYINWYENVGNPILSWWFAGAMYGNQPDVVYNKLDDEYFLVWKNEHKIWGKIIDWQGQTIKDEFVIISWPTVTFDFPHVTWNSTANQYLVVWTGSDLDSGRPTDISSMLLSADGAILTGRNLVISDEVGRVDLAYNPAANEFLVVFEYSDTAPGNGMDIYGVRLSAGNGVIAPGIFPIAATPKNQRNPVVASRQAGGYLVVWEYEYEIYDIDIKAQALNNDGSPNGGATYIAASSMDETQPAITDNNFPPGSQYHIVWRQEFPQGQAITGVTFPLPGMQMSIATWPFYDLGNPDLVGCGTGSFIVFDSVPNSGSYIDHQIYGFRWPPGVVYLPLVIR